MSRIFIGYGSNVGDRLCTIAAALRELKQMPCKILQISDIYETEPVGNPYQNSFLNGVVEIEAHLNAEHVLSFLLKTESSLGRIRKKRWGPRTIDLDLLSIESFTCSSPALTVPHPELANRRFVLIPFTDIAPDYLVSGLEKTVRELLSETADRSKVDFFLSSRPVWKMLNED
jgi:2-amino-4-hydroxy-6-hydroxymethyldihydropteridine diphosphokinase